MSGRGPRGALIGLALSELSDGLTAPLILVEVLDTDPLLDFLSTGEPNSTLGLRFGAFSASVLGVIAKSAWTGLAEVEDNLRRGDGGRVRAFSFLTTVSFAVKTDGVYCHHQYRLVLDRLLTSM